MTHHSLFRRLERKIVRSHFIMRPNWRNRLSKHIKENARRFVDSLQSQYKHGLLQFGASEGAWVKGDEIPAICGQRVGEGKSVVGTALLSLKVFGISEPRRKHFLQLHPFVMGLTAEEMYEKPFFVEEDQRGVLTEEQVQSLLSGWTAEGFQLRLALNLQRADSDQRSRNPDWPAMLPLPVGGRGGLTNKPFSATC
jgi:hypothetical protein